LQQPIQTDGRVFILKIKFDMIVQVRGDKYNIGEVKK
jgi:hypothetical protein